MLLSDDLRVWIMIELWLLSVIYYEVRRNHQIRWAVEQIMYRVVCLLAMQSARDEGRVRFRVHYQKRIRLSWMLASPFLRKLCPNTVRSAVSMRWLNVPGVCPAWGFIWPMHTPIVGLNYIINLPDYKTIVIYFEANHKLCSKVNIKLLRVDNFAIGHSLSCCVNEIDGRDSVRNDGYVSRCHYVLHWCHFARKWLRRCVS